MFEYFLIFLIMLACITVGIWLGMVCEKKANDKAEADRYRPLSRSPVETDLTEHDNVPAAEPIASSACGDNEDAIETEDNQSQLEVRNSPLSQKVNPDFDDELDCEEANAIEEKMRHQDASFNTLNTHTDE